MQSLIPYGRQDISEDDIQSVVEVLRSDWLTQGPWVPRFERALMSHCRAEYAVAVNSATSALHLGCLALGLGEGDTVWTSPITFVASANCALFCGASVDFVDIDAQTYNMSVDALERKLAEAERANKLPKVVVPVHFAGQSCDMRSIRTLADRYGFRVLEDASHALGGEYLNAPVGSCYFSDITVFSFHPVKIITSGEGGVAVTKHKDLAHRMSLLRSHGITREPSEMNSLPDGDWYYQQVALGFNYRMTDMQAALGASQMNRLKEFVSRRHELAGRYDNALSCLPVTIPYRHPDAYSALHLYPILIKSKGKKYSRKVVFDYLRSKGIGVNVHYIPVHLHPYYRARGFALGDFPQAENYYSNAISLPLFPSMDLVEQDRVVEALRTVLE